MSPKTSEHELMKDLDRELRKGLLNNNLGSYPLKCLHRWMKTHDRNGFCTLAKVYLEYVDLHGENLAMDVRPYVPKILFINKPWFVNLWAEAAREYLMGFYVAIDEPNRLKVE